MKAIAPYLGYIYFGIAVAIGVAIYFSPYSDLFRKTSFIFVVAFFAVMIYFIINLFSLKRQSREMFEQHFISNQNRHITPQQTHWNKISEMISSNQEELWRLAIIDADTMLEEQVTNMGYRGDSFGEKLKQISRADAPWIDAAWEAHRLRNILAHEGSRYPLNHREAYRAYKIYEGILYESGLLS